MADVRDISDSTVRVFPIVAFYPLTLTVVLCTQLLMCFPSWKTRKLRGSPAKDHRIKTAFGKEDDDSRAPENPIRLISTKKNPSCACRARKGTSKWSTRKQRHSREHGHGGSHSPVHSPSSPCSPGHSPHSPGHSPHSPGRSPLSPGRSPRSPGHSPVLWGSPARSPGRFRPKRVSKSPPKVPMAHGAQSPNPLGNPYDVVFPDTLGGFMCTTPELHHGINDLESKHTDISMIKPRKFAKDSQQVRIAMGECCERNEYPTMADVVSDWDSRAKTEITVNKKPLTKFSDPEIELKHTEIVGQTRSQYEMSAVLTETSTQEEDDAMVAVDPPSVVVKASGEGCTLKLTNFTSFRLAFKIKCTNVTYYQFSPVHGFIEPKGVALCDIQRLRGPPKRDRIEVFFMKAAATANNAKTLFATDATRLCRLVVPLRAVPLGC